MLLPNSICVSVSTPLSNIIANCIVFYKWKKAFSSSSEQQACFHYRAFVLFLPQKCTSLTNNCQALVCHPQITPPRALNKPPRAFHEPTQLSPSVTLMLWYTEAIWFSSQLLNFLEILQTHDMTWQFEIGHGGSTYSDGAAYTSQLLNIYQNTTVTSPCFIFLLLCVFQNI